MGGGGSGGGGGGVTSRAEIQRLERVARDELKRPKAIQPRQRAFLSFQTEDMLLVNAFRAQARSERSELDFIDMSLQVPFNSDNAEYIRAGIRSRIRACSVTIVLVGETTHQSEWVDWEIRESLRQGKNVVAVQLDPKAEGRAPAALTENGIAVLPWNNALIMDRLTQAGQQQ